MTDWKEYTQVEWTNESIEGYILYLQPHIDMVMRQAKLQNRDTKQVYLDKHKRYLRYPHEVMEVGFGTGMTTIILSRQARASGIDLIPELVKHANKLADEMKSDARFDLGDAFDIDRGVWVIHHQGLLEHFSLEEQYRMLDHQLTKAYGVVFTVPTDKYQDDGEAWDPNEMRLSVLDWVNMAEARYRVMEYAVFGQDHGHESVCVAIMNRS